MKTIGNKSPVTKKNNTKRVRTISVDKIISLYEDEIGINVSNYFDGLKEIEIRECKDTNYRYYAPSSIISDEEFYNQLKEKIPGYYPTWKWEYDQVLPLMRNKKKILEIGCGDGFFLKRIIEEFNDIDAFGIDLNQNSVDSAKREGINAMKIDLNDLGDEYNENFDSIMCFQLLEHINDINSFYKKIVTLLKPGGEFIVVVPYNKPYIFKSDVYHTLNLPPHHMGLWNDKSLSKTGNIFGLKTKKIIIEKLSKWGYDIERYFSISKDKIYHPNLPLKNTFDNYYQRFLRRFHSKFPGQNIICVYEK